MISRHAASTAVAVLILAATACGVPEQYEPDDIHGRSFFEAVKVQHLNGRWVATGADTQVRDAPERLAIATSSDGRTWSRHLFEEEPGYFLDAAYGNGRYVAVGGSHVKNDRGVATEHRIFAVSTDGQDWQMSRVHEGGVFNSVAFGGGVFLAVATIQSKIHRSTDGVNWEVVAGIDEAHFSSSPFFLERFTGLDSYGPTLRWDPVGERFLFAGGGVVGHSVDGSTWELFEDETFSTNVTRLRPQKGGMFGLSSYDCCYGEVENGRVDMIVGLQQDTWSFEFTSKRIPDHLEVMDGVSVGVFGPRLDVSDHDWSNWGSWDPSGDWPGWISVRAKVLITSLASGNGLFVAAGRGLMYSEDGRDWTVATID